MLQVRSRKSTVKATQEKVFNFFSDFRNIQGLLPEEMAGRAEVLKESCRFEVKGIGPVGLRMADKKPFSQIRIMGDNAPVDFNLFVDMDPLPEDQCEIVFSMQANMNTFMEMMARNPLQQFVDLLADKVKEIVL